MAIDERGVNLKVTATNETQQGFEGVKQSAREMANTVTQESGRASQSVGKIGDGGQQASQKVERATRSMIQSIQRTTAAMEAGSRTSAKYYETLAKQRGVDPEALRPYLNQLEEVRLKQERASAALGAGTIELNKYGLSAKQTAAAMRGVPAQLTDIVVSLQSGQRPMTVLLQQGGQLKDLFGGIVPAAQALGTTLLRMVNPMTLAAGAAVGLYAAYRAGASETENFQRTLLMTGNAAGVTADQLNVMAERVSRSIGTQRQAAAALNEFARSGKIAATEFERFSAAAVQWEKATGSAISETVKQFEELSKAPLEASLKLNDSMNYLTESTYRQIKALQEAGRETDAASLAQRAFSDAIHERAPGIVSQVGTIERAWHAVKGAISGAAAAMMAIGRPETVESLNTQLQAKLAQLRALQEGPGFADTGGGAAVGGTRGGSRAAEGVIANEARLLAAEVQMLMQEMTAAQLALQRKKELEQAVYRDSYLGDSSRQTQAEQRAAAIKAEQDAFKKAVVGLATDSKEYERIYAAHKTALLNIDKQYEEKKQSSGGISTTQTELARLNALMEAERQREEALHSVGLAQANLNEGERLAIQYAEKLKLATDEKTKAQLTANKALAEEYGARKRANDVFEKDLKDRQSAIDAAKRQTERLRDEIETYGMGKSAIEAMTIARLEEKLAIDSSLTGDQRHLELLRQEIEERQKLLGAMRTKEALDAQLKEWQNWEREVDRIFDQLGQSLTDQLFEGGKSARDMLKDLFKNLVLRVAIQPMLSGLQGMVTNQIGGLLGYQDPRQQSSSSSLDNLMTGNSSMLSKGIGWLGEKFGSTALQSFSQGMAGTAASFGQSFALSSALPATASWAGAAAGLAPMMTPAAAAGLSIGPGVAASLGTGAAGTVGAGTAAAAAAPGIAGLGSAFATALPYVGIGLAAASAFGLFDSGPPKTRHGQRTTIDYAGGAYGISAIDDRQAAGSEQAALAAAQSAVAAANDLFARIGVNAGIESFYAVMESSVLGDRNGVASGGSLRIGDQLRNFGVPQASDMTLGGFGGWSSAEMLPRLQTDIQLSVLEAFQAVGSQLPSVLSSMLEGMDLRNISAETAQELATRFAAVADGATQFLAAIESMPFEQLRGLSFDAAAGLVQLAGGVEGLLSAQQTYYQAFYSEAERHGIAVNNLTSALAAAGVVMPELTGSTEQMLASYRAIVEAQDLNTEAGRQVYVALMQASGAFAEVAQYAGQAAAEVVAVGRSQADIDRERLGLESQLLGVLGNTNELRRRELETLDASNRALQQQIWAYQDLSTAYSAMVEAGQREIAKLQESFGATDTAMSAYRSAVQKLESEFGNLIATIGRGVADLRGQVTEAARAQYHQARAVISTALLTGQLPQTADLTEAIRVAQQGVMGQRFASREDQQRAYLTLANEMEALQGIAEPELDAAQATLAQLENQYRLLRGMSLVGEDSLTALEQQLRTAIATEESARRQISAIEEQINWAKEQYNALLEIRDGVLSFPDALASFAQTLAAAIAAGNRAAAPATPSPSPSLPGGGPYTPVPGTGIGSSSWTTDYLYANQDVLKAYDASWGLTPEAWAQYHWDTYGKYEGRSYDVGTSYVPHDMLANIHKGEIIINPRDSDILRRYGIGVQAQGGGNTQALERRIDELVDQNKKMAGYLYQITKETKRTALNTEDTAMAVGAHSESEGAVVVY